MTYVTEVNNEVIDEIKTAIAERRFKYIKFGDKIVGFGTWKWKGNDAFVNRLYIEPEYRGRVNLLKILREWTKENTILRSSWKNRRRNHYKGEIRDAAVSLSEKGI